MAEIDEPAAEEFKPGWRLLAACSSLAIANLVCALNATTMSVALPTISAALHGASIQALWAGTSFLLASNVWQTTSVTFSHVFGRRSALLFALTLFTIGSIMCGVSQNFTVMLVGRCI